MNAIVEVATAEVVAQTAPVLVFAISNPALSQVFTPNRVATSPMRVLSIAGTSISAVSPDYNFIGGTALAA